MLEILDEVSSKMDETGDVFEHTFLIDGSKMNSPLEIPIEARILIVSKNESF
jgi:hypothetical protein